MSEEQKNVAQETATETKQETTETNTEIKAETKSNVFTQEQLDNIQEGKGYISQEQHDQSMLELKEEQQEIIRERSHEAHKYKLEAEMLREKYINSERRLEAQKRFYETALAQVLPEK